jgi:hypothetical protein
VAIGSGRRRDRREITRPAGIASAIRRGPHAKGIAMPSSDPRDPSDPSDRSDLHAAAGDAAEPDVGRELDLIERLALALVDNLDDAEPPEALSIGILPVDGDGLTVAVRPLLGADPIDNLVGFTAPAHWVAVGVVSTGRWSTISDAEAETGQLRRGARPAAGRARLAHIVTRQGSSLVVLRQDHDPPVIRRHDPREVLLGRADDVCRRILGLPTPPPAVPTVEWWAVRWADAVVRRAAAGVVSTWFDVAGAHPVVERLSVDDDARRAAADDLVELGATYADLLDWDDLRRLCATGQLDFSGVDPDDAAWMDAGMFSRWAFAPFAELADLLDDLDALLPEALTRRVRSTCRSWGLP